MNVLGKVMVALLAFLLVSPCASASITFEDEYETKSQLVSYALDENTTVGIDLLDIQRVNNYNMTIKPFFENHTDMKGIVQYPLSLPQKYLFNYSSPGAFFYDEMVLAFPFTPSKQITFGTASEVWFRLPISNISLSFTTKIRLSVWKLYMNDPYNLVLEDDIDDCYMTNSSMGETVYDVIFDEYVYKDTSTTGYPSGTMTDSILQYETEANFSYNSNDISFDYNFTYVRCNAPFETGVQYVVLTQLYTIEPLGGGLQYEFYFTDTDNNRDKVFLSQLNLGGTMYNISADFDTVALITDMASSNAFSVNPTDENVSYYFSWFNPNSTLETSDYITFQMPFFARDNGNLSVSLVISSTPTGTDNTSLIQNFSFKPGTNNLLFNFTFGDPLLTFARMTLNVTLLNQTGRKVDFAFTWSEDGKTIIRQSYSPFSHYYRLNATPVLRYVVSPTQIEYIPIDQYTVFVVPNPYDIEASRAFVQEAKNIQADIYLRNTVGVETESLWLSVFDFIMTFIFGATWIGAKLLADYLINSPLGGFANWLRTTLLPFVIDGITAFCYFIYDILDFVVHALSWIATHSMQLLALWSVMMVYLLAVYAVNGVCSAVTKSRRGRKKGDIFNVEIFDQVIGETYEKYIRLVMFNMSLIGALFVILSVVLKMVIPI